MGENKSGNAIPVLAHREYPRRKSKATTQSNESKFGKREKGLREERNKGRRRKKENDYN